MLAKIQEHLETVMADPVFRNASVLRFAVILFLTCFPGIRLLVSRSG